MLFILSALNAVNRCSKNAVSVRAMEMHFQVRKDEDDKPVTGLTLQS